MSENLSEDLSQDICMLSLDPLTDKNHISSVLL